jgi:hypothetical protein
VARHVRTPVPSRNCKSSISGRSRAWITTGGTGGSGWQQYTLLYPGSDLPIKYVIVIHAQQSQAEATQLDSLTLES